MGTRTGNCKICGSVEFSISTKLGRVDVICNNCKKIVKTLNLGKYVSINSECKKCNGKIFKATVTKNEEKSIPIWKPYCTNCGEEPKAFYADEKGNVLDRSVRELLIINDSIEELGQRVDSLDSTVESNTSEYDSRLYDLQSDLDSCESKVSDCDSSLYDLKNDIGSCESKISDFDSSLNDLERSCESKISDLEWKVDRLE